MGSEDESCESGITPNITGRGKKRDKKTVHLIYDQDREKNGIQCF